MTQNVKELNEKTEKGKLLKIYLWVLSFMYPYKWQLTLLILCGIAITAVQIAVPKFIQYFTDTILVNKDIGQFKLLLVIIIILVVFMIMFMAFKNILERIVQESASRDLQYTIYAHLRKLGFAYFEKHPIGESLALMNSEVSALQGFYRHLFPWMLNNLLFSIISVTVMLMISVKLSVIMFVSFLLYYIFGPYLEKKSSFYGKQLADNRVALNQKTYESISSINDIRANGSEKWDLDQFMSSLRKFNQSMITAFMFAYLRGMNRQLSYNIGGIVIIIYGVYLTRNGDITTGEFIAFLLLFFQTMHVLTLVITAITEQKVLMYQADKLYTFIQLPAIVKEISEPMKLVNTQGMISFTDVTFAYSDGPNILDNFNLAIKPGEKVAIVGESGSGKSTVLKLLGRFYDPAQGEITIDGLPINHLSLASLRENLGFVFQETYLFGTTVKENILFGKPDASDEEVFAAARAANADEFIRNLPEGYDTFIGERGLKLSGGQKQRISIARMFIKKPPILILDEATSALDNVSEREVQLALERLMSDRTTMTIAHRLSTIMEYDKIVLLDKGEIVEAGTYGELMDRKQRFYTLAMSAEGEGVNR